MGQPDHEPDPDELPPDPITQLVQVSGGYHEFFLSLQESGFSEARAFELIRAAVFAAFGGHL